MEKALLGIWQKLGFADEGGTVARKLLEYCWRETPFGAHTFESVLAGAVGAGHLQPWDDGFRLTRGGLAALQA